MKLAESKEIVQTNGHVKSIEFGIRKEDTGKILEFLRAKMYEDPIGAICREVACNARDANREAGKPNKPITIAIRDSWIFADSETVIMFTDEGPGISPSRMEDVFCNYGSSTKTNSNKQTGGFGLGAKTPFSYTDTFFVETNVDKIKYIYSAALNSAGTGEMILLSEIETEDPNGTSIIIPIKSQDKSTFQDRVLHSTLFWKIQPTLIGFTRSKLKLDEVEINSAYRIYRNNNYQSTLNSLIILIDDIQYPIPLNQFGTIGLNANIGMNNTVICFPFSNGELSISANRETLFFYEVTITKLKTKISKVSEKLLLDLEKELDAQPSLIQAHRFIFKTIKNNNLYCLFGIQTSQIESIAWKGNKFKSLDIINNVFQNRTMIVDRDYSSEVGGFSVRVAPHRWGNKQTIDIVDRILTEGMDNIRLIVKDIRSKATINYTIYNEKKSDIFIEPFDLTKLKDDAIKKEYLKNLKAATQLLREYGIDVVNYSSIAPTPLPKKKAEVQVIHNGVAAAVPVEIPKSVHINLLQYVFFSNNDRIKDNTLYFQRRTKKLFSDEMLTQEVTEGIYILLNDNVLSNFREYSPNWLIRNCSSDFELLVGRSLEVLRHLKINIPIYIVKQSSKDIFENQVGMVELKQIWKSKEFIKTYSTFLNNTMLKSWNSSYSHDELRKVFSDYKPIVLARIFNKRNRDKNIFSTQQNCNFELKQLDKPTVIKTRSKTIYDGILDLNLGIKTNMILSSLMYCYDRGGQGLFSSNQYKEKILEICKKLFII